MYIYEYTYMYMYRYIYMHIYIYSCRIYAPIVQENEAQNQAVKEVNIVETELLFRKALRIYQRLYGDEKSVLSVNDYIIQNVKFSLSYILKLKGNHYDGSKGLLEQCLASQIRRNGENGENTIKAMEHLVAFHRDCAETLPPGDAKTEQIRKVDEYKKRGIRNKGV
jgi:hypothetical protein